MQTTHAAQEAAKIATSTQTTIVCKTGCDLRTPANEAIQQIGWDQAHLVIHMRSWNQVHVEALPADVGKIEIELFCAGGRHHTYVLTR